MGNAHANIVPYQVFDAADGQFVLAVGNDGQFAKFCEAAGCALHQDARFRKKPIACGIAKCIVPLLAAVMRQRTVARVGRVARADRRAGRADQRSRAGVRSSAGAEPRMRIELPHPLAGTVPLVANPIKMSATPLRYEVAPPMLGQHTREVLGRLGIDERELEALARDGVIWSLKKIPPPLLRRRVSCGGRRAKKISMRRCGTRPRPRASPADLCARTPTRRTASC